MIRCGRFCWSLLLLFLVAGGAVAGGGETAPATPDRPKVGLVLGGGGALGFSHIGVLQLLEEMRIPVDYIGGTSMGSIIAGLYASGMCPQDMNETFSQMNWWDVMKDRTPYRDLDFNRKRESARYLMDLELGLKGYRVLFPHGFAAGQKLNNVLQAMAVNAAGIESFDDLNIPYRAIATDLRSKKPVILDHGDLATAMRASMAVPGAFTPVQIDGHLLVDGGLVNNIPVDVIKALGADIIIAVDVGSVASEKGSESDFNSLGEILSRTYDIMQRPKDDGRRAAADILIEPDLTGLGAGDFHRAGEFAPLGKASAKAHADSLERLALSEADYATWLEGQRRRRADTMHIRSVTIEGNRTVPTETIRKRVYTRPGDPVDFSALRQDMGRIHGMGDFETVTHHLKPSDQNGEYDLVIDAREKYWGPLYMHLGLRLESTLDSVANWSVLLNFRRSSLNELGGEIRADVEAGRRKRFGIEWYQPLQNRNYFFVAPGMELSSEVQDIFHDGEKIAEFEKNYGVGRLDFGVQYKQYGELRVGALAGVLNASPMVGATNLPSVRPDLGAITATLTIDRLDARVFVRDGAYLRLASYLSREELGADDEYETLTGRLRWVKSLSDHTFELGLLGGSALGSDLPVYADFTVGGMGSFPGFSQDELRGSYFGVGSAIYRYRLGRLSPSMGEGVYLLSGLFSGNVWRDSSDVSFDDTLWSGLLGVALDTVFGPIVLAGAVAEDDHQQVYLSIGTLFR